MQSIMSYNGGCVIAMTGKNCVAIAADRRFGVQMKTVAMDFQRIFEMGPHLYLGLPGLATDTLTVHEKLRFRLNLYELRENRKIKPSTFSAMCTNVLYERRFGPYFVEPVVAGKKKILLICIYCFTFSYPLICLHQVWILSLLNLSSLAPT